MADPDAPDRPSKSTSKPAAAERRDGWDDERPAPAPGVVVAKKAKASQAAAQASKPAADEPALDGDVPAPAREDSVPPSSDPAAAGPSESTRVEGDKGPSPFAFLRGGHAFNLRRGGALFAIGGFSAFLLMARDVQWRWGVPVGFVCVLIAVIGALDLFGSFEGAWPVGDPGKSKRAGRHTMPTTLPPAHLAASTRSLRDALLPGLGTLVALLTTMSLMANAVGIGWGALITVGWIATCALGFKTLAAVGIVDETDRPLHKRQGFWLIVFCCLLYLPTLGAHSLVDPWETHYGEVSREILARDDWITIWWAEEGYFLSKPILDFWMQALAMATFGIHYLPDGMIAPSAIGGNPTHPEWIVRLPSLTLSVVALYLAYRAVSHIRGRRAGLISALVLATMGDWFMLSHQSITDMPFVASITAAMSLLVLGLTRDDSETVRAVPIRIGKSTWHVSGFHLALGVVLLCALPQALYLVSRNFTLVTQGAFGFEPHMDEYRSGSGRECWIAPGAGDAFERLMRIGKWPCDLGRLAHPQFLPAIQGLLWMAALGVLLFLNRNERRISRLCFIVAWVFCGISTMGKGVAGIALPICVVGCYVLTARKWNQVLRLELASGVLVLATMCAPWFVAMYGRMGDEFIQQLFVHHMWKRALDHVHDTNTGDDVSLRYYVWQLGYAMFPWTGLVPAGLIWWARTRWGQASRVFTVDEQRRRDLGIFLVMWFVFAFGLFTYMKTKFHHYIFPAVPPAALLTGIFIDDALGPAKMRGKNALVWLAMTVVGAGLTAYGFSRVVAGRFTGYLPLPDFDKMSAYDIQKWVKESLPAAPVLGVVIALLGLALAVVVARRFSADGEAGATRSAPDAKSPVDAASLEAEDDVAIDGVSTRATTIGALALAGAVGAALIVRDLAARPEADIKGQERLIQLYTYRYDRVWPKELWFQPALLGFGLAVVALMLVLVARAYRRQAFAALAAVAALYAAWTLDDYMMFVAPHWGQRPIFEAYYKDRHSVREPLVAFEMNWKGENFYSGGRLIEFGNGMSQGSTAGERGSDRMRTWLADIHTKTGAVYFVTENGRISKIEEMVRGILGNAPNGGKWVVPLSNDQMDNKFVVVRARWGS